MYRKFIPAYLKGLDRWFWQRRSQLGAKLSVVLLLLPPALFGVLYFGWGALVVILASVISCWTMAILIRWANNEPITLFHPGSIITGLLIGMTCGPMLPLYMIIVGACVAEFLGKVILRNGRDNIFNPAVLGRSAIAILETVDPVPYADLSTGASTLFKSAGGIIRPEYIDAFMGTSKGAIGETSALILIIVGYLMLRYVVIKRHAALAAIITVLIAVWVLPPVADVVGHAPWVMDPFLFLIGGPMLLLSFFFVTDPVTTPNTIAGATVFGIGVGLFAVLGKLYTNIAGVEMYGILIMNMFTPFLNRLTFSLKNMSHGYE